MFLIVGNVEEAARLKEAAVDHGLRVRDKISHPAATRFVVALDHDDDPERLYVHASPNKISITIDLTDGASDLTYEEALERIKEASDG